MHRFYLPPNQCQSGTLVLTEAEAHHAVQVLRLRPGDELTVLDGVGNQFHCSAQAVSKKLVSLAVKKKEFLPPLPCQITLFQAIPKGKTMDLIVQKATELGVAKIVPLLTERVTVHLEGDRIEDKREKWQHVAIEAIKQCGQPWLPKVEAPITPKDILKCRRGRESAPITSLGKQSDPTHLGCYEHELSLVGALQGDSQHPRDVFREFFDREKRGPKTASVWIGPEGDFTFSEIELIRAAGAKPITLGRLVLRCETAAMYCLSVMSYELQI